MGSLPPPTMNKTDEQREAILDTIAQNGFLRQVNFFLLLQMVSGGLRKSCHLQTAAMI
jgi:hypothetical protein